MNKQEWAVEADALMAKARDEGWNDFLANPLVSLLLSMIPPGENPDILKTVLRAAFVAGGKAAQLGMTQAILKVKE